MPSLFILGLVAGKAVRKMDTLAFLGECAPAFAVRGCQVKVLTDPQQFYSQLCQRAANSKERIVMSALYLGLLFPRFLSKVIKYLLSLGTGEKAQHLVNCVQQSLQSFRPRTLFLLDFCRGNRLVGNSSSVSMLRPLLQDFEVAGKPKSFLISLLLCLIKVPLEFLRGEPLPYTGSAGDQKAIITRQIQWNYR